MPLLPQWVRDEFWWSEKRVDVESSLKRPVGDGELEKLIERGTKGLWPTCLKSLGDRRSNDDELWLFEVIPGDKGYALVRKGRVVDFSITEVTTITTD